MSGANVPSVSVLLPVFNAGRFLRPAVKSILDQRFRDFELIVINDGRNVKGEFHGSPALAIAGDSLYCKYTVDGLREHPTARAIVLGSQSNDDPDLTPSVRGAVLDL